MTDTPRSFMGRLWRLPETPQTAIDALIATGQPPEVACILAGRGISPAEVGAFIEPTIKDLMPDPYVMMDMKAGAERIAQAIKAGEKIGIWSDYDVDGATSAAVLGSFLRMCGRDFTLRIPDRIKEGYGPNTPGLLGMKDCDLVCILDAGIVAFEPLAAARAAGMDVVVIDHHAAEPEIPEAVAVINPNRHDDTSGLGHLCAAGVTFMMTVAVTRLLRKEAWFDGKEGRPSATPDLLQLLDLVALGTVCDVVPMKTLNRAFVRRGLLNMAKRARPGISALAIAAGINPADELAEKECGWKIGPRINAAGRIADPLAGAMLLLEENHELAKNMAEELDDINAERQRITQESTDAALAQFENWVSGTDRGLAIAVLENAHEGIVGIVAGRVKERCDAPSIVVTRDHDGNLKGSARSVPGVDIGHIIIDARKQGLIIKGGGHGMAGGLTLRHDQVEAFRAFANAEIAKTGYARTGVMTEVDLVLPLAQVTYQMIESLAPLRPFGMANPDPAVMLPDLEIAAIRVMKEKHIKVTFRQGKAEIDALRWNCVGTPFGDAIEAARGRRLDVIGTLSINEYRGKKTPQMMLEDFRVQP